MSGQEEKKAKQTSWRVKIAKTLANEVYKKLWCMTNFKKLLN